MIQREVQDSENVTWTCVQALSGLSGNAGDEAAERVERRWEGAGRLHAERRGCRPLAVEEEVFRQLVGSLGYIDRTEEPTNRNSLARGRSGG